MDQETILEQFNTIEKKIEHLIETCKRLETVNTELKQKNEQLQSQLQEKIAAEKHTDEIKALVRTKIDSLMGRLDAFADE